MERNITMNNRLTEILIGHSLEIVEHMKGGSAEKPSSRYEVLLCRGEGAELFVLKWLKKINSGYLKALEKEIAVISSFRSGDNLQLQKLTAYDYDYMITEYMKGNVYGPEEFASLCGTREIGILTSALTEFQSHCDEDPVFRKHGRKWTPLVMALILLKWGLGVPGNFLSKMRLLKAVSVFYQTAGSLHKYLPSHGDLTELNIMFTETGGVAFFDFANYSHSRPFLYDALFLCCHRRVPITEWGWQKEFLKFCLREYQSDFNIKPEEQELKMILRGLLVFIIIFWLKNASGKLARGEEFRKEITVRSADLDMLLDPVRFGRWFDSLSLFYSI